MNLIAYSQEIILDKNGDTTICINTNQAKFLTLKYYECEEKNNLLNICNESSYKDSIITTLKENYLKQDSIIKNDSVMLEFRKQEFIKATKRVHFWYKKYNRQVVYKDIFVATTIIFASISGFMYIAK
jgi:hypothetical protein